MEIEIEIETEEEIEIGEIEIGEIETWTRETGIGIGGSETREDVTEGGREREKRRKKR